MKSNVRWYFYLNLLFGKALEMKTVSLKILSDVLVLVVWFSRVRMLSFPVPAFRITGIWEGWEFSSFSSSWMSCFVFSPTFVGPVLLTSLSSFSDRTGFSCFWGEGDFSFSPFLNENRWEIIKQLHWFYVSVKYKSFPSYVIWIFFMCIWNHNNALANYIVFILVNLWLKRFTWFWVFWIKLFLLLLFLLCRFPILSLRLEQSETALKTTKNGKKHIDTH